MYKFNAWGLTKLQSHVVIGSFLATNITLNNLLCGNLSLIPKTSETIHNDLPL